MCNCDGAERRMHPATHMPSMTISKRGGEKTNARGLDSKGLQDEHPHGLPLSQILIQKKAGAWLKNLMAEYSECAVVEMRVHSFSPYFIECLT